jgi:hypothetical protein
MRWLLLLLAVLNLAATGYLFLWVMYSLPSELSAMHLFVAISTFSGLVIGVWLLWEISTNFDDFQG